MIVKANIFQSRSFQVALSVPQTTKDISRLTPNIWKKTRNIILKYDTLNWLCPECIVTNRIGCLQKNQITNIPIIYSGKMLGRNSRNFLKNANYASYFLENGKNKFSPKRQRFQGLCDLGFINFSNCATRVEKILQFFNKNATNSFLVTCRAQIRTSMYPRHRLIIRILHNLFYIILKNF